MTRGISVHIGLNSVDPNHYAGWSGPLNACEADAHAIEQVCADLGYQTSKLLTPAATRSAVMDALQGAASSLTAGDHLVLSYSGHGGQVPDGNGDETDGEDETWCLFDGQLVDDELNDALARLPAGVRVLVLSDSCHSGTVVKMKGAAPRDLTGYRVMPPEVASATYLRNQQFYDGLRAKVLKRASDVAASVILMSGCQDNQLSADGTFNGLFTSQLLRVWNRGQYAGDQPGFLRQVRQRMPSDQSPNYFTLRADPAFEKMRPFAMSYSTEVDGLRILSAGLADPKVRAKFEAAAAEGARKVLPPDVAEVSAVPPGPAPRGGTVVRAFWWGFHIEISHEDLAGAVAAADTAGAIVAAIGPVTGPAAPFVSAAGGFVALMGAVMAGMDRGRGVYLSMSWFALGVFVPTPV